MKDLTRRTYQVWGLRITTESWKAEAWEAYPDCFLFTGTRDDAIAYCSILCRDRNHRKVQVRPINPRRKTHVGT